MKSNYELKRLDGTKINFIGKGILIGIVVGFVVSLFRLSIGFFARKVVELYEFLPHHLIFLFPWILVSILSAYVIGRLIKSDPNIKGSGIPQIEGELRGQLTIRWFSVLWKKFLGAVLGLSLGLFLGREGPSIQLGSAVAQGISEKIGSTKAERKILISSGASAGLSAAFNAPIAGLLFVLEEVHHSFSPLVLLTAFSATIMSNFVSLYFFGLRPVLYIGAIKTFPLHYYWALVLLGIFVGLLGVVYQKVLLKSADLYQKISFIPSYFYGVIPILLVIPIGFFFPKMLGGGHEIILNLTGASLGIFTLLLLFMFRFCFSMISYGSGVPGGIFLPILSLGAIAGVFFGSILVQFFGMEEIYMKNFLIFAMAGYFAAISKAPLTSMVLITEMIGTFSHLMSIGVVVLISYIVVDFFNGKPIYESLLEKLIKSAHFDISGKKTIIEFSVLMESSFDDQMVRDIQWPKDMLLTSLRRGEKEFLTHGDTVIHAGDTLIILTDEGIAQKIKDFLVLESQLTV